MRYAIGILLASLSLAAACSAGDDSIHSWLVVGVSDGDTLRCLTEEKTETRVRLDGIDAPERGQPFGTVATNRMKALVQGHTVEIHHLGRDRYGRVLARVFTAGQDVGRQLVAEGLAWHYTRYSDDKGLAEAERKARASKVGLWRDSDPVPPWEWRAGEKELEKSQGR